MNFDLKTANGECVLILLYDIISSYRPEVYNYYIHYNTYDNNIPKIDIIFDNTPNNTPINEIFLKDFYIKEVL
jgi:hypothetical protein